MMYKVSLLYNLGQLRFNEMQYMNLYYPSKNVQLQVVVSVFGEVKV